ncbi:MAG: hypothetical protein KDC23_07705 [Actinobacteria bacterium]|nr:hypothetical protein [Actinomycetota bacterium]
MHAEHSTRRSTAGTAAGQILFVHGVGGPVPGWDAALANRLRGLGVVAGAAGYTTVDYTDVFSPPAAAAGAPTENPPRVKQSSERIATTSRSVLARQPQLRRIAEAAAAAPDGTDGSRRVRLPKLMPSEFVARLPLPGMWHAVAYRNDPQTRRVARERVATRIERSGPGPRIVIAHSLGSLVVLDALHLFDFRIDTLITVGSPLGIDDGRTYEWDARLEFPSDQIGGWLNVVNTRDPVPWGRGASRRFPQAVDAFITAGSRLSGPGGFHDPGVYTGSTVVAHAVADSLNF